MTALLSIMGLRIRHTTILNLFYAFDSNVSTKDHALCTCLYLDATTNYKVHSEANVHSLPNIEKNVVQNIRYSYIHNITKRLVFDPRSTCPPCGEIFGQFQTSLDSQQLSLFKVISAVCFLLCFHLFLANNPYIATDLFPFHHVCCFLRYEAVLTVGRRSSYDRCINQNLTPAM